VAHRLGLDVGLGHAEALLDVPELTKKTRKSANRHGNALTVTQTSIYVSWMLDHGGQTAL
jgi:hypothetical protein